MADFKPLLVMVLIMAALGLFFTYAVNPYVDEPATSSILTGFVGVVENGINVTIPIVGSFNFNPVTLLWFGIDSVTDWVVDFLGSMSHLPDPFILILLVLFAVSFGFVIFTLIRGN